MKRSVLPAALGLLASLCLGCINVTLPIGAPGELEESVVHGDGGPKILLVHVDGVISDSGQEALFGTSPSPVARLREELDLARDNDDIEALLVRIDSPGGTVTASDILYEELRRFKQDQGIPVVAQLMGVAASGGYYVAMAADEIVAQPTSVTGSIGVIFGSVNITGLLEKIGVEDQTLVSGSYKDAGSMLRTMTREEKRQLQSVLDDMFGRFLDVVATGRSELPRETVEKLADGRIYSARQALEHGLVDRLGGLEDAVGVAEARAGISTSQVVTYHRGNEPQANLYSATPGSRMPRVAWPGPASWSQLLPEPAFLYLWTPGAR